MTVWGQWPGTATPFRRQHMGVTLLNLGEPSRANTHKKRWFCLWPTKCWHSNVRHTPPSILPPFWEQGEWQLSCTYFNHSSVAGFLLIVFLRVLGLEAPHQAITSPNFLGQRYQPRSGAHFF